VISRHHQRGNLELHPVQEHVRRLELAVAGALTQVTRYDDRGGIQAGQKLLEGFDLFEIRETAEVEIREVRDDDGDRTHQPLPSLSS
jgi:hypothetical protein